MSTILPPATKKQVEEILNDDQRVKYMVVGKDNVKAWKIALAAAIDMPGIEPIRIDDLADAGAWLNGRTEIGIVFGFGNQPVEFLSKADAENKDLVFQKLNDSMST